MANKKAKVLTEEFLVSYLTEQFKTLDKKFDAIDKRFDGVDSKISGLEIKINDVAQESREHINAVARQLNLKIDRVDQKIVGLDQKVDNVISEMRTTQFAIRTVKEDVVDHEHRITKLEVTV